MTDDKELMLIDIIGCSIIYIMLAFIIGGFIYYQKTGEFLRAIFG